MATVDKSKKNKEFVMPHDNVRNEKVAKSPSHMDTLNSQVYFTNNNHSSDQISAKLKKTTQKKRKEKIESSNIVFEIPIIQSGIQ